MKILFVGGQCVPGIGGVESYMLNMARTMTALGHDTTIMCSDRKAYTANVDGIKVVHKVCPKSNTFALPILFFKSLGYIYKHRRDIDVVNFQAIFLAFIPGIIVRLFGCKALYTIHSLAEDNPKHGKLMQCLIKIVAFISIHCSGRKVLTISESKRDEIKGRYGKDVSVIPCGVDLPLSNPQSDICNRFGINIGHYYLTIGRIDPIKNLDILINAFLQRVDNDYQLVIAGDYENEYGHYLRDLAHANKNIIFVGRVAGSDKEFLLKNCFVNCLVSSSEGMPISLLEAMAYGKSSIVSDIPAIREIMRKDWGLWCSVRDIDTLLEQMNIAEKNHDKIVGGNSDMITYVESHHTWDNIVKKYIDYINS